ncbi:MAG TPA: phosphate uptake regulator PhoU [Euzebyales bacterium]
MTDDPLTRLEAERRESGHARQKLQEQLVELDCQLIAMMRELADRVRPSTEAFLEADTHAAGTLAEADAALTRRCTELEESGYLLLATQSPVATDLRRIIAVLRSVNDVQRTGNLLTHVVESLSWVHPPSLPGDLREQIAQLGEVTATMLAAAATAWTNHDALAAEDLERQDDQADLLQKMLLSELYTGTQSIEESVSLGLIARYYERAADHAVELTRHLTFFLTGDRLSDRTDTD